MLVTQNQSSLSWNSSFNKQEQANSRETFNLEFPAERKKFYKNIQKVSSRKKCVKYKHLHKKILKTLVFYFSFYYNVKYLI